MKRDGFRSVARDLRRPLIAIGLALLVGVAIGECRHRRRLEGVTDVAEVERYDDHNIVPLEEPR